LEGARRRCSTGRAFPRPVSRRPTPLPLVPWRSAPTTGPLVRRLRPGLSFKGQRQTARGVGRAGRAQGSSQEAKPGKGRPGTAWSPTRHRGFKRRPQQAPKQRPGGSRDDRVVASLPSHANRPRKTARDGSAWVKEMCLRFRSRSSAQYFSPRLALPLA
jgi:hypothetical protein